VHTRLGRPANFIIGKGQEAIYGHDPEEGLAEDLQKIRAARKNRLDLAEQPDLGELVSGHVQPPPHGGLTCFVNVMGLGLQFAAPWRARIRGGEKARRGPRDPNRLAPGIGASLMLLLSRRRVHLSAARRTPHVHRPFTFQQRQSNVGCSLNL
jgi:hypothetical protein